MKELTPKEAIKILHPDTSRDALWKIEYYAGFNAEKARLKAVEDACVVACEALEKQIPMKPLKAYDEQVEQHWLSCPMCYKGLCWEHGFKPKHCSECGQAILWEGNE